ncbi:uncharacterized protein LOC114530606 [Dendronephthya gigantea]|uniref:uncharacterized protein LOC114530606 n=1 Tax=Dendronephthya gigantea TaxID=151771 RepID=UPI00106B01B1|nr:uncharacterized protein LOC114530606 [Dendronephthya gigantea]
MTSKHVLFVLLGLLSQVLRISSYFDGPVGDSDVFENPTCQREVLARNACECKKFNAECVSSGCQICKCRKKTRIYRSDVRKCLSDIEARDPWCRYQFVNTRADIIPTINLSKKCPNNKCSKPINAPFDKTKLSCQFSWVNYLENGTWHEKSIIKFQNTFHLQGSDYFSDDGYMYSLEWKGSSQSHIRKQLFQVSLECLDRDNMKETYCLMFRVRGKNNPILYSGAEIRQKTTHPQTSRTHTKSDFRKVVQTNEPTRFQDIRRREDAKKEKIVLVNDNFTVILAAIAGALGTALIIVPIAMFCRRTSRRHGSMAIRSHSANREEPSSSFAEEIDIEPKTSEETLSSYTSLTPNRDPPSIYQPLRRLNADEPPDEEPIYISVSGDDEEEPVKVPPIYHVLEDLRQKDESGQETSQTDGQS